MSKGKNSPPTFTEYAVFALFVAVVVLGVYFVVSMFFGKNAQSNMHSTAGINTPPPRAMTSAQYETEASSVMSPFFAVALNVHQSDFKTDESAMVELVTKTQERMLAIKRIPVADQNVHLSLILLLDQWKRALAGSAPDQKAVLQKTADVVTADPWLSASSAPAPAPVPAPAAQ